MIDDSLKVADPFILGVAMDDCKDVALKHMKDYFGVEHLANCADYKLLTNYPIRGMTTATANRLVAPFRVQNKSKGCECDCFVYFVIDTGSPHITFSEQTYKKLVGDGDAPGSIFVQGQQFPFLRSKDSLHPFKNVNLLGMEFFLKSNTSVIFSPYKFERPGIESHIFFITPLKLTDKVQQLASCPNQNPSILKKLSLESNTEMIRNVKACSDIRYDSAYLRHEDLIISTPLAINMGDCADANLLCYKADFGVDHLMDCNNHHALFNYPIRGIVKSVRSRMILPLRVQNVSEGNDCDIVVFFVVDTGASEVSFSEKTCEKLIGKGIAPESVKVQNSFFPFMCTKDLRPDLKDVNLLGSKFFTNISLSVVFSPYGFISNGLPKRVFYVAPVSIISGVKQQAEMKIQKPCLLDQLKIECSVKASQSDVRANKEYHNSLQIEFSRPSTAFSYGTAYSAASEEQRDGFQKKAESCSPLNDDTSPPRKRLKKD